MEGGLLCKQDDVSFLMAWKCNECPSRNSHIQFFNERDWEAVRQFWSNTLQSKLQRNFPFIGEEANTIPPFIVGDDCFSWTNLQSLHQVSVESGEFNSRDQKYSSRCTYALTIGYDGSKYNGYQQQKGSDSTIIRTVEDDVEFLLRRKVVAAGRTDKDVSAMSQVISFHCHDLGDKSNQIMDMIERRINRFDDALCNDEHYTSEDEMKKICDIEETLISNKRKRLQEKLDKQTTSFAFTLPNSPLRGKLRVWDCQRVSRKFHPIFSTTWRRYIYLFPVRTGVHLGDIDVDVAFIRQSFSRLVGKKLSYNGFAHRDNRETGLGLSDKCTLFRTQVELVEINTALGIKALAIELVGDRFLRRMVRILVATAVRESCLSIEERDDFILYKIALTGERERASLACSGIGLALCGVGFDFDDLRDYKNVASKRQHDTQELKIDTADQLPTKLPNPASRRRKTQQKNVQSTPPSSNISRSVSMHFESLRISNDSWRDFRSELSLCDPLLMYYPQRCFSFSFGDILLSQSCENVSSTIWDAEVVLAHFLDRMDSSCWDRLFGRSVSYSCLELGAGCGLAAIVVAAIFPVVKGSNINLILQEIDEVSTNFTRQCVADALIENRDVSFKFLASLWGTDIIDQFQHENLPRVDFIIMGDVFYHADHFPDLLLTVNTLIRPGGSMIFAFEQRRKDLLKFLLDLLSLFASVEVHEYIIEVDSGNSVLFVFVCIDKVAPKSPPFE